MGTSQKFNIMDFSPIKSPLNSDRSRLRMRGVKTKGVSTGLDLGSLQSNIDEDDEEDESIDYNIAEQIEKKKIEQAERLNDVKLHELEKAKLDAEIKNLVSKRKEKESSS